MRKLPIPLPHTSAKKASAGPVQWPHMLIAKIWKGFAGGSFMGRIENSMLWDGRKKFPYLELEFLALESSLGQPQLLSTHTAVE